MDTRYNLTTTQQRQADAALCLSGHDRAGIDPAAVDRALDLNPAPGLGYGGMALLPDVQAGIERRIDKALTL